MVDDYNRRLKQAVTNYNREAAAYNREVKRVVDKHNREVRVHNARVRSNRQRLNAEIARLNRQRSTTRYGTVQTSTIAMHTVYSRVMSSPSCGTNVGRNWLTWRGPRRPTARRSPMPS
ncbi:hypothetical protein [Micromonospora sp. NPDC047134]|uniref:hypothetical protein n=1 Tax=Micromonospora sp. NPDC047134 TaxID=3154340 RepID=UPI0033F38059